MNKRALFQPVSVSVRVTLMGGWDVILISQGTIRLLINSDPLYPFTTNCLTAYNESASPGIRKCESSPLTLKVLPVGLHISYSSLIRPTGARKHEPPLSVCRIMVSCCHCVPQDSDLQEMRSDGWLGVCHSLLFTLWC